MKGSFITENFSKSKQKGKALGISYCNPLALRHYCEFPLKIFLSIVCLSLIGCLSVSVFSPEAHSYLFHGGDDCPHHKHGKPCASHQNESSDDQGSSCAVVLFGKSSEHLFTFFNSSSFTLLDLGVSNFDSGKQYFSDWVNNRRARSPPVLV